MDDDIKDLLLDIIEQANDVKGFTEEIAIIVGLSHFVIFWRMLMTILKIGLFGGLLRAI